MARNHSEQEPVAQGVPAQVAEVIRADARAAAGVGLSEVGHRKFTGLSYLHQRLYYKWNHHKKKHFYRAYKAWLETQST